MATPEYNSYHSSPRSPTIKEKGSSPSDRSNSPNSPPKYGRRLLIQELLSSDQVQTQGGVLPQNPSIPTFPPMKSTEILNSSGFLPNLTTPEQNTDHYNNNSSVNFGATTPTRSNFPGRQSQSVASTSPTTSEFPSRQSQSPPSIPYVYSPTASSPGAFDDPSNESLSTLSVAERRERNKVASAKYRAKKHKQTQEMGSQIQTLNSKITGLVAENGLLERQLLELKDENAQLKGTIEELKMQLVEDNILKRLGKRGVKGAMKVNSNRRERTRHGSSGHAKGTMASSVNTNKST